jgi:hypothetical protein
MIPLERFAGLDIFLFTTWRLNMPSFFHRVLPWSLCLAGLMVLVASAHADNILIVNGASTTSESSTTAAITANLKATCFPDSEKNTVMVVDTPPTSLAGYNQIWDMRFSNPLTTADQNSYTAFLQSGGRMFVMGENSYFMPRNNSILSWTNALGGGTLTFYAYPLSQITENVDSPYNTTPNSITTITYNAPGGVTSPGSGSWITNDGTKGSAVVWATGKLANATAGSLSVVFDVNFMETSPTGDPEFLENLCQIVKAGGTPTTPTVIAATPTPVPTLDEWGRLALFALLLGLGLARLRRNVRQ